MDKLIAALAAELKERSDYVANVVALVDEGNTIPFIARYRKELHGGMDDTTLRNLADRLSYLRNLDARRGEVKRAIEAQGKLTGELALAIDEAATLAAVEDLYRPYKPKRRTRATIAKEKGLEPLAMRLLLQDPDADPAALAQGYLDSEKGVESVEDALSGASDILAETFSDNPEIRGELREMVRKWGELTSAAAKEEESVYQLYYDFTQRLSRLQGHQILAINRGEKEGFL